MSTTQPSLQQLGFFHKIMFLVAATWLTTTLLFHLFFLSQLSNTNLEKLKTIGYGTAVTVEALSEKSLLYEDQQGLSAALKKLENEVLKINEGYFEVNVIRMPEGSFVGSSNNALIGKKAHPALVERLGKLQGGHSQLTSITYQVERKQIKAYQVLRNVESTFGAETRKVAVVQVLLGYEEILSATAQQLWTFSLLLMALVVGGIWLYSSRLQTALQPFAQAVSQLRTKKFELSFPPAQEEQIDLLQENLKLLSDQLRQEYHDHQRLNAMVLESSTSSPSTALSEASLRKTELTCLCARIPRAQDMVVHELPEAILSFMNQFMEQVTPVVQENGGQVAKVLGDKVYVLYEGINSINNALRSALQLNNIWKEINREKKVRGEALLDYGMGIHSALGISGGIGQMSGNYTFLGDSARLAEYLCSCSQSGEILIGAAILERAHGSFKHQPVIGRKAADYAEKDEIFCVTDSVSLGEDLSPPSHKSKGSLKDKSKPPRDASLTDMLDETMDATPLSIDIKEESGPLPDIYNTTEKMLEEE